MPERHGDVESVEAFATVDERRKHPNAGFSRCRLRAMPLDVELSGARLRASIHGDHAPRESFEGDC